MCVCVCVFVAFFSIWSTRRLLLCLRLPFEFASVGVEEHPLANAESAAIENKRNPKLVMEEGVERGVSPCETFMEHLGVCCVYRIESNCPVCRFIGIVIGPT